MAKPIKMWQAEDGAIFHTKEEADQAEANVTLQRAISSLLGKEMASDDSWNDSEIINFIVKYRVELSNLFADFRNKGG